MTHMDIFSEEEKKAYQSRLLREFVINWFVLFPLGLIAIFMLSFYVFPVGN